MEARERDAGPTSVVADMSMPTAEGQVRDEGGRLIRRAPTGYVWNQAGALWLFVSLLLFEVVVRRSLPRSETNVFDLVSTAANLGFYLASLGLTSAGTVFLPRALAEDGPAQALALALRLVVARVAIACLVGALIVWGLPLVPPAADAAGWAAGVRLSHSFTVRTILQHRAVIAAYVVGVGTSTLLSSLLIALVRTRVVFIFGSLAQLLLLALTYVFIYRTGWGVDGALLAQAVPPALTAVIFAFALWRLLGARPDARGTAFFRPAMRLGTAAWLADLPNSSLVQPLAIGQLAAVAPGELLFFKSTYQMGDAGARFFTDGLGGVSMAVMSASYAAGRLPPLAAGWRTVCKLQVLLAVPLVVFSIPHAGAILTFLFGPLYAQAGYLLAVFLVLNGLAQLLGGSTHEWALYVLGRQRWVVVSRWATLGILAVTGAVLVPRYFALGALLAVGIGRLAAQIFLLALARVWVRRPYPVAFAAKLLLALIPPALATTAWQLSADATPATTTLGSTAVQGLALAVEGAIFLGIFLAGLWVVRPLDAEDAALLQQAPVWLRAALTPFVARARRGGARGVAETPAGRRLSGAPTTTPLPGAIGAEGRLDGGR